jgi:hypothetical protein
MDCGGSAKTVDDRAARARKVAGFIGFWKRSERCGETQPARPARARFLFSSEGVEKGF